MHFQAICMVYLQWADWTQLDEKGIVIVFVYIGNQTGSSGHRYWNLSETQFKGVNVMNCVYPVFHNLIDAISQ